MTRRRGSFSALARWREWASACRLLIMGLVTLLVTSPAIAQSLSIYTEISGNSQQVDKEGRLSGSSVEIVRAIQSLVGDASTIQVVPWSRGYQSLQSGPAVMLFATTQTSDRMPLFKWVGPILTIRWTLYAARDSRIDLKTLEDARKVGKIGTYKDDAREKYLQDRGFTNLVSSPLPSGNFKSLVAGRLDLVISSNIGIFEALAGEGIARSDIKPVLDVQSVGLYLAFSRDVPDETVARWQAALDQIKRNGEFGKIYHRYYPGEPIP